MQVLLLFLLTAFIIGGTSLGTPIRRRPWLLFAGCSVAAAMYYSIRVVQ
ncbi:MAG: hypothetical protein AAF945_05125 [Actinomycetota bacterium]